MRLEIWNTGARILVDAQGVDHVVEDLDRGVDFLFNLEMTEPRQRPSQGLLGPVRQGGEEMEEGGEGGGMVL